MECYFMGFADACRSLAMGINSLSRSEAIMVTMILVNIASGNVLLPSRGQPQMDVRYSN